MTTYNYSLNGDFGGPTGLKMSQLHTEIDESTGITGPNLVGINTGGDDVDIIFDVGLLGR